MSHILYEGQALWNVLYLISHLHNINIICCISLLICTYLLVTWSPWLIGGMFGLCNGTHCEQTCDALCTEPCTSLSVIYFLCSSIKLVAFLITLWTVVKRRMIHKLNLCTCQLKYVPSHGSQCVSYAMTIWTQWGGRDCGMHCTVDWITSSEGTERSSARGHAIESLYSRNPNSHHSVLFLPRGMSLWHIMIQVTMLCYVGHHGRLCACSPCATTAYLL